MADEPSVFSSKPENVNRLFQYVFEQPVAEDEAPPAASVDTIAEKPGGRIDRYLLQSILGEGGMGIVYLAEQEEPVKRLVALKVIKPGMDSRRVIARFKAEQQTLALMNHPHIANVYDAGLTLSGRLYFVMEYVQGLPITDYCDQHRLTIEQRLRQFQEVCQAVQHAHQKGIIHRDIKPSNILVSTEDDKPTPKIIDFGVAKALNQPLTERTLATEDNQLLGTPEYMSPEQADMATEDNDTRSDIYSLGALLYELLTGVLPFDSDTLRTGGIERIRQIIRETDPKTPSTRLTKLGEEATKLAENRRTEILILAKSLKKELEWIPLKAMRKDRAERYRSASELADDIENYLKGAPLLAGPLSTVYRFKKFVRRNRVLVTGIAAVLLVLIVGVVGIAIFAIKAERRRSEAQLVSDFLRFDVLGSAPRARIGEATVAFMLDAAAKVLRDRFQERPLIEASLRETLGWTYRSIGEPDKAERHFEKAIEIYRQLHGDEHPDTLQASFSIGWVYEDQGRYRDMEHLWTTTLQIERRVSDTQRQAHTMNGLAIALHYLGKNKEAESLFKEALKLQKTRHDRGEEDLEVLPWIKCNLARVYTVQGRYDEAEKLFRETIETAQWPVEHRSDLRYATERANMYREQGQYDKAEFLFDKTLETLRKDKGDEHFLTTLCMCGLVQLYVDQDRYEEANASFNEVLPIARRRLRKDHPVTIKLMNTLAVLYSKQKHYDEAEGLFDEVLKGRQRELGDDHPDTLESKNDLAVLFKQQGDHDKSEPLLLEALEGRRLKLGDKHPHTIESWQNMIDLYEAWNKPEKAKEWRTKLQKTDAK